MKKTIVFIVIFMLSCVAVSALFDREVNAPLYVIAGAYLKKIGDQFLNGSLTINGWLYVDNISVSGDVFNVSVVNYNVTGTAYMENISAEYIDADILLDNGSTISDVARDATGWNKSVDTTYTNGINVNISGNVTINGGALAVVGSGDLHDIPVNDINLFYYYGKKAAVRIGQAYNNTWNESNIGSGSFAQGLNVSAKGTYATCFGDNTICGDAPGDDYTVGFGDHCKATSDYTFVGGINSEASGIVSFAFGNSVEATNKNTIALGKQTRASNVGAIAMGNGDDDASIAATSNGAMATGSTLNVGGDYATVTATQTGAFARGYAISLFGPSDQSRVWSHGLGSVAFGYAIGSDNGLGSVESSGQGSFAVGLSSCSGGSSTELVASGDGSVAMGLVGTRGDMVASGDGSFAQGYVNNGYAINSTGDGSFAQGYVNKGVILASGDGSFAQGTNVRATGDYSLAVGNSVNSTQNSAVSFGRDFQNNKTDNFAVGFNEIKFEVNESEANFEVETKFNAQNITDVDYVCFNATCEVYLHYNGSCIISSNGGCI